MRYYWYWEVVSASFSVQIVLGSALCNLCSTQKKWEILLVQALWYKVVLERAFVQALWYKIVLGRALCKLRSTK